ncbi:MAG: hypothetical protein ACRC62_24190 [Microcoleus sp.]
MNNCVDYWGSIAVICHLSSGRIRFFPHRARLTAFFEKKFITQKEEGRRKKEYIQLT